MNIKNNLKIYKLGTIMVNYTFYINIDKLFIFTFYKFDIKNIEHNKKGWQVGFTLLCIRFRVVHYYGCVKYEFNNI